MNKLNCRRDISWTQLTKCGWYELKGVSHAGLMKDEKKPSSQVLIEQSFAEMAMTTLTAKNYWAMKGFNIQKLVFTDIGRIQFVNQNLILHATSNFQVMFKMIKCRSRSKILHLIGHLAGGRQQNNGQHRAAMFIERVNVDIVIEVATANTYLRNIQKPETESSLSWIYTKIYMRSY